MPQTFVAGKFPLPASEGERVRERGFYVID
jgi:hypothetical protein